MLLSLDTTVTTLTIKGASTNLTIIASGVSGETGDFMPENLVPKELPQVFNLLRSFLNERNVEGVPAEVNRFSDKGTGCKRIRELAKKVAEWLATTKAVTEFEAIALDGGKVIPFKKGKLTKVKEVAPVAEGVVELKGSLKNHPKPQHAQKFTDKCQWLVGVRKHADENVITVLKDAAGHSAAEARFALYQNGQTVAEWFALAYKLAEKRYPELKANLLRFKVLGWLDADAKAGRISTANPGA
jgi:hypothetical protein